jgi:hypothetical protein
VEDDHADRYGVNPTRVVKLTYPNSGAYIYTYMDDQGKPDQVVSSRVERLVYTEAAESSNPSLPTPEESKQKEGRRRTRLLRCLGNSVGRVTV